MTISPRRMDRIPGTRMKRSGHCTRSVMEVDRIAEVPTHGTSLSAAAVLRVVRLTHSYSSEGRRLRGPTLSMEIPILRDCGMEDSLLKPLAGDRAGKTCASSYLHLEVIELVHTFVPETYEGEDGQDGGENGEDEEDKDEPRLTSSVGENDADDEDEPMFTCSGGKDADANDEEDDSSGPKDGDEEEDEDELRLTSSGSRKKMLFDEALAYWEEAKEILKEQKEKYEELLEVVREFAAKTIGPATMGKRVKFLLGGHRELLLGFNAFLPKDHKIIEEEEHMESCSGYDDENKDEPRLTSSSNRKNISSNDTLAYWKAVKETLEEQKEKYEQFLEVVLEFAAKTIDPATMERRVKVLLGGHPELLLGFNAFLPRDYQIIEEEEHDECGSCGQSIKDNSFWIVCYTCSKTFHCKCVHYDPTQAKNTQKYKCQSCHDTFCGICRAVYTHDKLWIKCYYCHKDFHCKCVQLAQDKANKRECYRCPWCSHHRSYR